MNSSRSTTTNIILFSLVAGQALFYFVSGKHHANTEGWNMLVGMQFIVAVAAIWWNSKQGKKE